MMLNRWILLPILMVYHFTIRDVISKNAHVSVTLQSSWEHTSIISESSEFLFDESPVHFWHIFDHLESVITSSRWKQLLEESEKSELCISWTAYREFERVILKSLHNGVQQMDPVTETVDTQLLRLFLSSRTYSPAVEMAHQLGLTAASKIMNMPESLALAELRANLSGSTWATVGNKIITDIIELKSVLTVLDKSPSMLDEIVVKRDKVYPPTGISETSALPKVFLYGDLEKPDLYSWHKKLKSLADEGRCVYIFRHFFKERRARKVKLSGYGVELALKSTEYKAMDDSVVENASSESSNQTVDVEEDTVVRGFNFTQLNLLHPDLAGELGEFQNHLLATDNQIRPLKAWQLSNLNMQASQMIMWHVNNPNQSLFSESPQRRRQHWHDRLHPGLAALQDISQNFPVRAGRLVSVQVGTALIDEVTYNQAVFGQLGLNPGQSLMLINGLLVSPSVDIFVLLDLLREEMRILSRLKKLGVPSDDLSGLLTAASDSGQQQQQNNNNNGGLSTDLPGSRHSLSGRFAVDLTTAPVLYANDLETNVAYSIWPESLRSLFAPDFSGGIRRLRKNVNNLVLVVDPASPDCWQMIRLAESFLLHRTALRVGLLWSFDPRPHSPSLLLVRLFHLISTIVKNERDSPIPVSIPGLGFPGRMAALSFLTDVYTKAAKDGQTLSVESITKIFKTLFPDSDIDDFPGLEFGDNQYDTAVEEQFTHLRRLGLTALASGQPLVLFNGIIFDQAGIKKMNGLEYAVINLCMEQVAYLQAALYQGQMSSGDSVFDLYKKNGVLLSRFNNRILSTQNVRYLNLDGQTSANSVAHMQTEFLKEMRYFQKGDMESALRPLTMWVVIGDLGGVHSSKSSTDSGTAQLSRDLDLALAALAYFRSPQASKDVRLGFVFNPTPDSINSSGGTAHWLLRLLHLLGYATAEPVGSRVNSSATPRGLPRKLVGQMAGRNLANRLLREASDALKASQSFDPDLETYASSQVDVGALRAALQHLQPTAFLERHAKACRDLIGLKPGERAVVINGRLIGPLPEGEEFTAEDFKLAERLAVSEGARRLGSHLSETVANGDDINDDDDSNNNRLASISELTWRVASVLGEAAARSAGTAADGQADSASTSANKASIEGILSRTRIHLDGLSLNHSGFVVPGKPNLPTLNMVVVVNPCSRHAQRLSQLLIVLHQAFSCRISVYLNPMKTTGDLPVKNFYRFVWEPSLFAPPDSGNDSDTDPGDRALVPRAQFSHLPGQPLLTLGVDAPHGWMVAAVEAVHDLDNLRLDDIASSSVEAVFDLEYLLLEGHASQETSVTPPRGLQLTLGPAADLSRHDTIVMANLGYFQLKANPGAWYLGIRSGKSRSLYTISSFEDIDQPANTVSVPTTIYTFRSNIVSLEVRKRPERMNENLLDEDNNDYDGYNVDDGDSFQGDGGATTSNRKRDTSVWSWVDKHLSSFTNYAEKLCPTWLTSLRKSMTKHLHWSTCTDPQETINVFSLASGHLYERLLRIMMLTVIRHTKSPVKFWFLKNYLSPTFKDFIPHMAAEYGFQYELVQYQWPRWLNAQTEKQRIIWGYKILFLDVLFPLNVTKIIYVDADQIVRADLQELVDLNLEGAPYGYTPFCDSRSEMDGFRFWKHGYWANHLAGRPYHISALYVVDLARFRQLAAGDRLRGQYHGLSHDPNSLSNLDQDLPNNMIHQVPIKSLPQEWLWCETWCSDETKPRAKTIDLCNNPMTKEPKLSAAMRIAPEWVKYDQEIKRLWRRIYPPAMTSTTTTTTKSTTDAESPPSVPLSERPDGDKKDVKTEL